MRFDAKANDCHGFDPTYTWAVAEGYTWREIRGDGRFRLPGPDHLGWWVTVSLLLAIILHVVAFLALGRIKIALGFEEAEELRTAPVKLDQVEIMPPAMDDIEPEKIDVLPPDATSLLEEIDVLDQLPENAELDLSPEVVDPEFAIKPQQPLAEGAPEALELDPASDFNLDTDLPELGHTEDPLPPAAEGQVIVDPGDMEVEDPELDRFTEEILKKGGGGTVPEGALDGVVTLDDLVGLPENVLVGKKTMLPSDLLFEYDSAELRESARIGLMKLALLVERNPGLYCWIEGHTDLFGGNRYNLDLARRRSQSVKRYLTESLRLDGEKIATRGYGKTRALVAEGSIEEQALNRRVEIKMRREPPPDDEPVFLEPDPPEPEEPAPVEEPAPEPPPKAVLVKPMRELPVRPAIEEVPRAVPVEEEPPRAEPVEEDIPRAEPVPE